MHRQGNNEKEILKKKIEQMEKQMRDNEQQITKILSEQKEFLKLIAKTTNPFESEKIPLRNFQKSTLLNLLKEKPRDFQEIEKIFDNLPEIEVLNILNDLLESSLIKQDKNKYTVIS